MSDKLTKNISHRARDLIDRGLDRHIRLAITGLSGAGKTALLSGLLEQMLYANDSSALPYWRVAKQQRLIGARLVPSSDWSIARFDYEGAVNALTGENSSWPQSTRDVSEIRIELKFKPVKGLASKLSDSRKVTVDLIDYPGEWLLDLPMLAQNYQQWSEQQSRLSEQGARAEVFAGWHNRVRESMQLEGDADETIRRLARDYQQQLQRCKKEFGLYFLQPGRHLLPGELADAPALDFFPWPTDLDLPESWGELLQQKYHYYQQQVIKPFYKSYFQDFNRQVILVDVLTALEAGEDALSELKLALTELMKSFEYGNNHFLKRLLSPQIDRVALVASKVDHIGPDQHAALRQLLAQLLQNSRQQLDFERIEYKTFSVAGISVSQAGQLSDGTVVLDGFDHDRQRVRVGAPKVPATWPNKKDWQIGFAYPRFYPHFSSVQSPLPHIRLDQLLDYLLGDKLE
ncbi:YcjX family protein [Idiomarina seosinensis]|uniref:YcjX family protein n=1 Tax=Idiomarina seosinensis TaxID=281739 RepID=UPI001F543F15|nr:YcjX family protein [Idiomarina seosinensis]